MTDNKINDGGPAFPKTCEFDNNGNAMPDGLTKREWFAGQALVGYLSEGTVRSHDLGTYKTQLAKYCFECADAMIEESQRGK